MKNIKNKLKKTGIALAILIALGGCGNQENLCVRKTGTYNGMTVNIWDMDGGQIKKTSIRVPKRYWIIGTHFDDLDSTTIDIYEISMAVPKNHKLRKYANPDSLEKIRKYVIMHGKEI